MDFPLYPVLWGHYPGSLLHGRGIKGFCVLLLSEAGLQNLPGKSLTIAPGDFLFQYPQLWRSKAGYINLFYDKTSLAVFRGVDLWLPAGKDGVWKITSVVNEVIPAGEELTDETEWKF